MAKKWLASLALMVILPLAVRAGGADKPTITVRVKSLDTLVENAKLLVTLSGREEIAKQVEGLIKAKIGNQGLEGIDPARPFGAYARFGKELDDITGAVLIPIANERAFLGLLENLNLKATKGNNEIYTIQTGSPIEVYLRFANGYAYASALNAAALEGKLPDPIAILGKEGPAFSATVRLDQLPEAARQIAIAQIEQGMQDLANKKLPNKTAAELAVREAAARQVAMAAIGVLKDGGELNVAIDLSDKTKELSATFSLAGKPGTELAQVIQNLGRTPSQFGALRAEAAFRGLTHIVLPEAIKKGLGKVLDEGATQGLEKIQDANKRKQAQQLIDALMPTLKAGDFDGYLHLLGPRVGNKYAIVAGIKLQNGDHLGATLHDLVADAIKQMPEAERTKIQLNHASAGSIKIHRLDLPTNEEAVQKLGQILGETNLYVAFRKDAAFVAIGQDSLAALKEAIAAQGAGPSPVFLYEIDVARLAPILAPTEELRTSAKKIFVGGQDGMVRLALEGGSSLRLSITTRLPVLQFLSQTRQMKAND